MQLRLILLLLLFAEPALAQNNPAPIAAAPPTGNGTMLIELSPGEVRCDGEAVPPLRIEPPLPISAYGSRDAQPLPIALTFRIDAAGRPLGIALERRQDFQPGRLFYSTNDVAPAFATSRFAAGSERKNCRVRFDARAYAPLDAPLPLVRRYFVAPHSRQPDSSDLFRRLHPADTDCIGAGSPKLRLRAIPAFEEIPIEPGGWAYAMAGFDIDARGRPVNVRIAGSDGNAALDRATVAAVRKSRYAREARSGCTYPYYRRSQTTIEAPPLPEKADLRPVGSHCEGDTRWTTMPELIFPTGFNQRRIEGWAIVAYDVAPWGQTGNVRVLAAEPAAAFGDKAKEIVGGARQDSSATGKSGCVDVVRFVMPVKDQERIQDDEEG